MGPKHFSRVAINTEPGSASRISLARVVCRGRTLRRLAAVAVACLLLAGCTLFGKSDKSSQKSLSPSFKSGVTQTTTPKKTTKDSGGSWLTSWMRPKEPDPPRSIGEWMELPQSKLPPSKQ
jgi:hypothetical protein